MYDAVLAAAHAAWQSKLRARRRSRMSYALAASVLLAIAATALWSPQSSDTPIARARVVIGDVSRFSAETGTWSPLASATNTEIESGDRIRTMPGGRVELELLPGTSVRLAEGTELEIATARALRLVDGTVYVDSGTELSDLRFDTPFGTLRNIGTQFEIRVTDAALRLRVRSGRVELMSPSGAVLQTAAQEQLDVTRSEVLRGTFPAAHSEWAWIEDLAVAPLAGGETISAYLTWIARETGRQLEFDTETTRLDVELDRFNGDPGGLTLAQLLDVIGGNATNFEIEVSESTIRVRRRDITR